MMKPPISPPRDLFSYGPDLVDEHLAAAIRRLLALQIIADELGRHDLMGQFSVQIAQLRKHYQDANRVPP